jgi:hypothetical protein
MTVLEIIQIAEVSQYLAVKYIAKNGAYGKGIDLQLPRKLYCVRKNTQYRYDQEDIVGGNTPSVELISVSNKLYSLCGMFAFEAQVILNGSSGGGTVNPTTPHKYPIVITSADFESDGVSYNNPNIVGDNLELFPNQLNQQFWYAGQGFFVYTATGIRIIYDGFSANTQDWTIRIDQVFGNGVPPVTTYPYIFDNTFDSTFN